MRERVYCRLGRACSPSVLCRRLCTHGMQEGMRGCPCRNRGRAHEKSVCRRTCGRCFLLSHTRRYSLCRGRADRKHARMWSQRFDSSKHLAHRIAYFGELLLRQAETRRKIETLSCNPFRHWIKFIVKEPLFTKNRLFVHTEKERTGF